MAGFGGRAYYLGRALQEPPEVCLCLWWWLSLPPWLCDGLCVWMGVVFTLLGKDLCFVDVVDWEWVTGVGEDGGVEEDDGVGEDEGVEEDDGVGEDEGVEEGGGMGEDDGVVRTE